MTVYTTPATKSTGNTFQAADWNTYVRDNLESLARPAQGHVYKTAAQTITTGTPTQVTWPSSVALVDVGLVSNTLVPTYSGWFVINSTVEWVSNATGYRLIAIRAGGGTIVQDVRAPVNGAVTTSQVSWVGFLTAGVVIDIIVMQGSGGSLNVNSGYASFSIQNTSW